MATIAATHMAAQMNEIGQLSSVNSDIPIYPFRSTARKRSSRPHDHEAAPTDVATLLNVLFAFEPSATSVW